MKKGIYFLKGNIKSFLLFLFVYSLLYAIEAVFHPLLLKWIFDEAILEKSFRLFFILITAYLIFGLFVNIFSLFINIWGKRIENRILSGVVNKLLNSYFRKNYNFILQKGEGYFVGRVYKDVIEGLLPFLESIKTMSFNLIRALSFAFVLFYISWQATLSLLIIIPFVIIFSNILSQKIKRVTSTEREREGEFINILTKSISSYKIVRTFRILQKVSERTIGALNSYLNTWLKNFKLITTYRTGTYIVMNISDFCSLLVGALFVLKGKLTFGGYLAFVTAFWREVTAVSEFFRPLGELSRSLKIIDRLYEFEKEREEEKFYEEREDVVLKDVYFSYNGKVILNNFSLNIRKGERVLIEGPNGSGKTTLANIISGFLKPQKGKVVLPKKVSSLTFPWDFPLLKVRELPIDRNLLEEFGLSEFYSKYADELSMGQKQKLAISLVLSFDSDLYVFDEPTANLDKESIPKVMKKILEKTEGKTLIVIMHKGEEWYKYFDRILNIEKIKGI